MNERMNPGFARVQMLLPWFHQLDPRPLPRMFWPQPHPVGNDFPGHLWLKGPCTAPDTPSNLA